MDELNAVGNYMNVLIQYYIQMKRSDALFFWENWNLFFWDDLSRLMGFNCSHELQFGTPASPSLFFKKKSAWSVKSSKEQYLWSIVENSMQKETILQKIMCK
jgi:hypothetical protein